MRCKLLHVLAISCPTEEICGNFDTIFTLLQKVSIDIEGTDVGGNTALHQAVKEGKGWFAKKLMDIGARADVVDDNVRTLLHTVALQKVAIASVLSSEDHGGFDEKGPCSLKDTDDELHWAVESRDWKKAIDLVSKGANIDTYDSKGFTVIQKLAQFSYYRNEENIFGFMVNRGANINVLTPDGDNLLHLAAKHKNWPIVERLLKLKLSAYEPDSEGLCVLHRLAQDRCIDRKSLRRLLRKAGVTSVHSPTTDSLLHVAVRHENFLLAERLVRHADLNIINQLDSEGLNVLHRLVQYQPKYGDNYAADFVLKSLVIRGANPNIRTSSGDTALHLAAKHHKWHLIESLVEHGCDVNDRDSEGFFIIHRLAQTADRSYRFLESPAYQIKTAFRLLLNKKADLSVRCPAGDTALHLAARHNNWNLVKHLIEQGCDVRTPDSEGFYILHRFAQSDRYGASDALFLSLVDKGADVNCKSPLIKTPLHVALKNQNWDLTKRLAELGADVRECDINGMSALHIIAQHEVSYEQNQCISLIKFLIEKGADIKVRCPKGDSFLHVAAKHDNWEIVEQMISNTPCNDEDVNEKDSEGFTILHRAASSKTAESSLLDVLLNKGAKCDIPCPSGECALHLAVKHGDWCLIEKMLRYKEESQSNQTLKQKQWLNHFSIDTKDEAGNTVLHLCAKQSEWDQVHQLLMSGADPGLSDDEGHAILYRLATEDRDTRWMKDHWRSKVLQCFKCTILRTNECDEFGDRLIQIAARNRNLDLVQILLPLEDYVNVTDIDGCTLLHRVVQCKSLESLDIVQMLLEKSADIEVPCRNSNTALHLAVKSGNWDIVRELLMNRAKVDDTDKEGISISHRRTNSSCQLECVADFDRNTGSGKSLFHELAKDTTVAVKVAESVTKHLLSRGLDVNERDSAGDTPLNVAAKHGNWRVVRLFAEVGADASIPDREGWFVCHRLAMYRGFFSTHCETFVLDLLSLFTSKGLEVNQKGPDGKSSLQTVLRHKNWEMVCCLVQFGASYVLSLEEKKTILENVLQIVKTGTDQEKIKRFIKYIIDKGSCRFRKMRKEIALCETKALQQIISQREWDCAKALVEWGWDMNTEIYNEPLLHFVVSECFSQSNCSKQLSFLDALLARGVDINCRDKEGRTVLLKNWVYLSADCSKNAPDSLFHVLLNRGADPSIGDAKGISLLRKAVELNYRSAISSVKVLIDLGVSTYQPALTNAARQKKRALRHSNYLETSVRSPTQGALEKNNVVAFKMLVESGASSNKELFELNTRYQVQLASKDNKSAAELEMLDILRDAASEPRSLKSLCCLTVSHAVGCRPRRKKRSRPFQFLLPFKILSCFVR